MAENSNYIGLAMGLDVTDLKAGLTAANQQISLANAEFQSASAGMEDWRKSTEGVTAKVKQLETVLGAQKSKLAGLEAEYNKVKEAQGENSLAALDLKKQLLNQEAIVKKTEREYENYKQTLEDAESGIIDLEKASLRGGKAVEQMGEQAVESSEGFTVMKGAMATLVADGIKALGSGLLELGKSFFGLAESTREYREDIGKLQTAFEVAGHTSEQATDTYKELFSVFGEEDRAVEAAQQIAKLAKTEEDMAKMTNIATGVWGTFGDSLPAEALMETINSSSKIGEVQGNLADALEWSGTNLDDFNAKLSTMKTEEERSAYIIDHLNGLYGEAADIYRENNKEIMEAQLAQSELTDAMAELGRIAEPIMTMLKNLATETLKEITPFVKVIGEGLTGALNGTAGATEKLTEGISGLLNALVDRLMNMAPTVLGIILELLPKIANTVLSSLPMLLDVILQLVTSALNLLSELAPQIVTKVVEIVPLLIEKLLLAIPQLLEAAILLLNSLVEAIPVVVESLLSSLPSLTSTIIDVLLQALPMLIEAAITLFNSLLKALPVIMKSLEKELPRVIDTIVTGLISALPLVLEGAITLLEAIIDAIPFILKLLTKETPRIVKTITSTLLDNIDVLIEGALELFFSILEAIPELLGEISVQVPSIISAIVSALAEGIPDMLSIGWDLIQGVIDGMLDFNFGKAMGKVGDSLISAFEKVFDINSPSKVMAGLGEYLGEGVGVGMLDSMPALKRDLSEFSDYVTDNVGGKFKSASSRSGVGGSTVINAGMTVNYNGTLSRKQLKQIENDQYTKIATKLKSKGAIVSV